MADATVSLSPEKDNQVNTKALLRFFSVDSNINMAENIASTPEITISFYSRDFLLKIAELTVGIVCAALYGEAVKIMTRSVTFICFPNVVFSSFIIITAVIIISYMLGQVMPDVLVRVFNSIGIILYFISATVTITIWCSKDVKNPNFRLADYFLFAQAIMSYLNAFLYGLDMYFNVKKAVAFEI